MLVAVLYKWLLYEVSPSLRSCFTVLLIVPKSWRLLLLSVGQTVMMHFILSGCVPIIFKSLGYSFDMKCLCRSLLWPIHNLVWNFFNDNFCIRCSAMCIYYLFFPIILNNYIAFNFSPHFSLCVFFMYALVSLLVCSNWCFL